MKGRTGWNLLGGDLEWWGRGECASCCTRKLKQSHQLRVRRGQEEGGSTADVSREKGVK